MGTMGQRRLKIKRRQSLSVLKTGHYCLSDQDYKNYSSLEWEWFYYLITDQKLLKIPEMHQGA